MRLHDLRHTWFTRMLTAGASLHELKQAGGHSSIAVTSDVYGHLVKSRLRDVVERMEDVG